MPRRVSTKNAPRVACRCLHKGSESRRCVRWHTALKEDVLIRRTSRRGLPDEPGPETGGGIASVVVDGDYTGATDFYSVGDELVSEAVAGASNFQVC